MYVIKRNGSRENVQFDKITERIRKLSTGLNVQPEKVAQKTLADIYDGITTTQLDTVSADIASNMSTMEKDYDTLAVRIYVSNMHKTFPLPNEPFVDNDRDNDFTYFGLKTMEKIYLQKNETPQAMFLRVARAIHGSDQVNVEKTYEMLSLKQAIHATPTMINAGSQNQQMSSCFLTKIKDDSMDGIYKTLRDCALISKHGGGIGIHAQHIRSKGSRIKSSDDGKSDGIIPMLRVFNSTARYSNQNGKRKGSFAIYLEPWHPDIFDFLELRLNQGDEEARCRDLFLAMWIPDLFMKCVEQNGDWYLFDPDECPGLSDTYGQEFEKLYNKYVEEGRERKMVPAALIWKAILKSQIETGTPYIMYKDTCNIRSNQKNLGTLTGSNLCVAPETPILTKNGYVPIHTVCDKNVEVWNGSEWSSVTVKKTSDSSELIRVQVDTGTFLECTPEHKFYVKNDYHHKEIEVRAKDLVLGDKLIKFECEPIEFGGDDFKYPYTHGFFCGDGTYSNSRPTLALYGEKMNLLNHLEIKSTTGKVDKSGRINTTLYHDIPEKFVVPSEYSIKTRLQWLSGYMDADGSYAKSGGVQITCIHLDFLHKIQLMLHTLGVQSKITMMSDDRQVMLPDGKGGKRIFDCKKIWRICISQTYVEHLVNLGLDTKRLDTKNAVRGNRRANWFPKVQSVTWTGRMSPTYCFTEPKKHMGVFNGLLTGQCTEILEYTDAEEISVCNLASISLPSCVSKYAFDFDQLYTVTKQLTVNLNRIIDANFYPVKEAKTSNEKHRPIGIGVQGLADVFMMLGYPYGSEESRKLNSQIFETIYYAALEASSELARIYGPYESYAGSPASHGFLQFDLAKATFEPHHDWDALRQKIKTNGLYNSLLIAPMPTATTSQVLGNNECFEPYTTNIYVRRTLAGEFTIVNKHLVRDLQDIGLWSEDMKNAIIRNGGSVQDISSIPQRLKDLYKTAWEISPRVLIDMARDRGIFVCQSQSMNLYVEDTSKLSSIHMYGWKQGLKTGSYYIHTRPKASAIQVTIEPQVCRYEPGCLSCGS
jgi:ribonucleoside-diphosphate reductase alpha chain